MNGSTESRTELEYNGWEIARRRERRRRKRAEAALLFLFLGSVTGGGFGFDQLGALRELAASHDALAASHLERATELDRRNAELAARIRADSLAFADSVAMWERARAEDLVAIAEATGRASELAASIDEQLDSATAQLFASYRAEVDTIIAGHARNEQRERARADALEVRVGELMLRARGLEDAIAARDSVIASKDRSLDVRDRIIEAQSRRGRLLKIGGAVIAAALVVDLVRSR